jgi:hypothetical protein
VSDPAGRILYGCPSRNGRRCPIIVAMSMTITGTAAFRGGASRRLVGLERQYRCASCSGEHRSWARLRHCPGCGTALGAARIRRAALA